MYISFASQLRSCSSFEQASPNSWSKYTTWIIPKVPTSTQGWSGTCSLSEFSLDTFSVCSHVLRDLWDIKNVVKSKVKYERERERERNLIFLAIFVTHIMIGNICNIYCSKYETKTHLLIDSRLHILKEYGAAVSESWFWFKRMTFYQLAPAN